MEEKEDKVNNDDTQSVASSRDKLQLREKTIGLRPGFVLDGRFELIRRIGQGGMGEVFEANHRTLDKRLAVKILHEFGDYDELAKQRFLAEARIQSKLKHPNIVEVTDADISPEGHHYIVMELLDGKSLGDWMEEVPIDERNEGFINELTGFILEVCDGLSAAHERNIVHRDLKPSNVFLHTDEAEDESHVVTKILDFGLAKQTDIEQPNMTLTGDIPGTTHYISPEQILGKKADRRSDIYALGVLLYEGLTGEKPFEAEGRETVFYKIVDKKFKPSSPRTVNLYVPERLGRICMKAMERNPDKRYQSVDAMSGALYKVPMVAGTDDSEEDLNSYSGASTSKWKLRFMIAALAVIVLTGLGSAYRWLGGVKEEGASTTPEEELPEIEKEPTSSKKTDAPREINPPTLESPRKKNVVKTDVDNAEPGAIKEKTNKRVEELIREGYLALDKMNLADAAGLFDEVVKLKPGSSKAWFGLGAVASEQGRYRTAANRINRALRYDNKAKWRIRLGQVYLSGGNKSAAIKEWERILKEHPNNEVAKGLLIENGAYGTSSTEN